MCSIDVLLHVDDGKGTTDTPELVRHMLKALERQFKVLKMTQGDKHNYLSMVFDYSREKKTVEVTMPTYATKIADSYETPERGTPLTPPTLFKEQLPSCLRLIVLFVRSLVTSIPGTVSSSC